ncbi:unnamed protein product [Caenorhabditis auriculariae]|uniref:Ground-like domain-containing protein n=1 Tax=Caenorhabditis auriculariae TaxID=2777116 RepID=A0A8S1H6V2_9PELO|nr:unnamed protein product [Caenorhabditis auriculariae]
MRCLSLAVLLGSFASTAPFLFDLPLLGGGRPAGGCCCPAPPPPCGGPAYVPPPVYEAPPPPPPPAYVPPPGYSIGIRRKRETVSGELEASSSDLLCNSPTVKNIITKAMSEDAKASREKIHRLLSDELSRHLVVVCSSEPFEFTATHDSEFCAVKNGHFTCSAFVF